MAQSNKKKDYALVEMEEKGGKERAEAKTSPAQQSKPISLEKPFDREFWTEVGAFSPVSGIFLHENRFVSTSTDCSPIYNEEEKGTCVRIREGQSTGRIRHFVTAACVYEAVN